MITMLIMQAAVCAAVHAMMATVRAMHVSRVFIPQSRRCADLVVSSASVAEVQTQPCGLPVVVTVEGRVGSGSGRSAGRRGARGRHDERADEDIFLESACLVQQGRAGESSRTGTGPPVPLYPKLS